MSTFAYCQHPGCDYGLAQPGTMELRYGWRCLLGHENDLPADTVASILEDHEDRIVALEARIPS